MTFLPTTFSGKIIAALWATACVSLLFFAYFGRGARDTDLVVAFALLVLCFPVSLGLSAILAGVFYLLDVWFDFVIPGGFGFNVFAWLLFVILGYLQWRIIVPHVFGKKRRMLINCRILTIFWVVAALTGCVQLDTPAARITGSVTYRERIALPPSAVVKVQLVDVSRADAPATVLGEQVIKADGRQVPFAFAISYDPKRTEERFSYAVQARIEVDGQLRFINDQRYPVLTRGAGRHVELVLRAVGAPAPK